MIALDICIAIVFLAITVQFGKEVRKNDALEIEVQEGKFRVSMENSFIVPQQKGTIQTLTSTVRVSNYGLERIYQNGGLTKEEFLIEQARRQLASKLPLRRVKAEGFEPAVNYYDRHQRFIGEAGRDYTEYTFEIDVINRQ